MTTFAPSIAILRADASPTPSLPPVMNATLPSSSKSNIVIICVPTPINKSKKPIMNHIASVVGEIKKYLQKYKTYKKIKMDGALKTQKIAFSRWRRDFLTLERFL